MTEHFGITDSEEELEHILVCRQIVKSIMDYGITQQQLLMLIQFLSSEIENHEQMAELVTTAREFLKQQKSLLVDKVGDNG